LSADMIHPGGVKQCALKCGERKEFNNLVVRK
jgi:hypothetical protein